MLPRGNIKPTVQQQHDRIPPGKESGGSPGSDPVKMRDGVYRALRAAVELFVHADANGHVTRKADALAEASGANRGDTYLRVARGEDSKGNLQRAFLDFLGYLFVHRPSALAFVSEVNALLDLEPPVPQKTVDESDIGSAWLKQLAALPPGEREGRIHDMAAALGVRVEDLKAKAGIR